jgi:hypothetical protein
LLRLSAEDTVVEGVVLVVVGVLVLRGKWTGGGGTPAVGFLLRGIMRLYLICKFKLKVKAYQLDISVKLINWITGYVVRI